MTSNINSKIVTVLAVGFIAAFAAPAFASVDVEANPLASGRYIGSVPGPVLTTIAMAHAEATRPADTRHIQEWTQFERAVGGIR